METVKGMVVGHDQGSVWEMEPGRPTTFKLLSEQTGDSMALFEEIVPVGGGTPLHVHPSSDEIVYVINGEFTFKIGEELVKATSGACAFIPRGMPHGWRNTGNEPGKAVFVFAPAENAKFFEEMRKLQIPITSVEPATLASFCQQYGYELITFDWG